MLEFGDDVTIRKKTSIGSIQKETVDKANSYDISRIAPERRYVVTVREEDAAETPLSHERQSMLRHSIKESNPDVKIDVSKVAEIQCALELGNTLECLPMHLTSDFHTGIEFHSPVHPRNSIIQQGFQITLGNSQMSYSESQNTCSCNDVMFN